MVVVVSNQVGLHFQIRFRPETCFPRKEKFYNSLIESEVTDEDCNRA